MSVDLPSPFLVADSKGLDFLNSIGTLVDEPVDWLHSGEGFLRWLREAELAPPAVLDNMARTVSRRTLDQLAGDARDLREWFRGFVHAHKGSDVALRSSKDLEPLNNILARDESFVRVAVEDGQPIWIEDRHWRAPDNLLQPIAREIARVICGEDFSLIRACEGHHCTLMFIDRTKSHRRRWCSMAVCGNRAKQSAHRERSTAARTRSSDL
jgi:predicted RNA-binding Zn ribbon-like protein